ncbi:TPA: AlgP family protein, partial [Pseudomonas putida]
MSAKKKPVSTPLHLLQQLSGSLLEHLEDACSQALADAEKLLAKLEKQRGKAQEKLHNGRLKLQDAAKAGKAKAQSKAQKAVGELEGLLDALKERQTQTRSYIQQLKRDAQDSLKLAQGVGKVREAAAKALDQRAVKTTKPAAAKPAARTTAAKPAAKPAAKATAAAKPAAKPAAKTAAAAKPAAKPAAKATAAAKPAAKPAAKT